jgi:hypothetical protein
MRPSTTIDFSCVTAKAGLLQATVTPAAAGGAGRIQHDPDKHPALLRRNERLGNIIGREGEHLDADCSLGGVDQIEHRLARVLRLDDRACRLDPDNFVLCFHARSSAAPTRLKQSYQYVTF